MWIDKEVSISQIEALLENGYEVEVDSPDGWVGVNHFIHKGIYDEYVLEMGDEKRIHCNEDHLFETTVGWASAKQLSLINDDVHFLTKKGYVPGKVRPTYRQIPIVDINVNHKNHRYYTDDVSSHNTGVGKSLAMCAFASSWLIQGHNVLYITAEMSEEKIGERIDANLFDIPISEMENIPQETFSSRINKIKKKSNGKLIIKEYPTASANVNHFRALLNELNLKKSFKPDIIVIDYLNICASSRMKTMGGAINSYSYIKAIAEEIRGLAVEFDVPILSATQTTRSGYSNSDPGLEDTSESFGLPATADLMLALVSSEELEEQNLIMVKQLKNRYADVNFHRRFTVGINRSKMKMFDAEDAEDLIETEPVFDKTEINERFKDFKL